MATYKILQDIEAEDKLVGPLSLRQFIYAGIAAVAGFIAFKFAAISIYMTIPFLPIIILFGTLAFPWGRDQPNEIWLLARITYFLKPHRRIWNQNGIKELVEITTPKKIEKKLTKDYGPQEAESRLKYLAKTLDTHGWAVKNVNVNLYQQPMTQTQGNSDRLVQITDLPKEVPTVDVSQSEDIFEDSNPKAQHINEIITANEQRARQYHQQLVQNPTAAQANPQPWFVAPQNNQTNDIAKPITKPSKDKLKTDKDNAILKLATDNNRSIASLAHEARVQSQEDSSDEVVISLH